VTHQFSHYLTRILWRIFQTVFVLVVANSAQAQELVSNGGFETGLWNVETVGAFTSDNATAHSGSRSAKAIGSSIEQYMSTNSITVNPYNIYRVGIWVKSALSTSAPAISLNVLQVSAANTAIGWYAGDYKLIKTGGTQNWTHYTATLDKLAPSTVAIKLYARLDGNVQGTVWFDDVSLTSVNQLAEPGFESGLWPEGNWSSNWTFVRDSVSRHSGKYAAKVNGNAVSQYMASAPLSVSAGENYKLSLWIKTNAISTATGLNINVLQANDNGSWTGWYSLAGNPVLVKAGGTRDWTRYEVALNDLDPRTTLLKVYMRTEAGISGSAWLDDVVLTQAYRDGFLWGVNAHADTTNSYVYPRNQLNQQFDAAAGLGIGIYRINLTPYYDAATGKYDWSYLDEVVNAAYNRGLKIYLVVHDGDIFNSPLNYLYDSGKALAQHYQGKIAYYQLGNELDNYSMLSDAYDGSEAWMYDATKIAATLERVQALGNGIHAGDPYSKRVINIGWLHTAFLEQLNAGGAEWEVNALDWYWDTGNMFAALNKMQTYRQQEILIAESNTDNGTQSFTEQQQADYIVQNAKTIYYRAPSKVKGYIVYELLDETGMNPDNQAHYGLIYYTLGNPGAIGAKKKAYGAYSNAIRRKQ
jgi:hypothetical protein